MQPAIKWIVDMFVGFNPYYIEHRNKNGRYLKTNLSNCTILKFYPNVKKQIDRIMVENHVRYYEIANNLNHTSIIKAKRDIAILLFKHGDFTLKQIITLSGLSASDLGSVIDISKLPKPKIIA